MELALLLVSMAAVVLAATAISERLHVPAPLLLIVVGAAASYVPMLPTIHLESEVVLLGLLPPLLYAAAIQTSLVDFNANRGAILRLSVVLVVVTSLAVAAVVQWLVPGIGWAAAIAIGAVVAPPDAVAATAVAKRIGLPRRVVTILEGESLLNDATALVALRTAIAFLAGSLTVVEVGLDFVRAAGGGALIGFAFFLLIAWLRKRITDPLLDTGISFLTPFAAFVAAEEIHASGVISVVVAGLLLGHKAPIIQTAQSRITERITWRTVAFILENTVFLLIGLQLDWILEDVRESTLPGSRIALVCLLTLVTVIVVRLVYMYATWLFRRRQPDPARRGPSSSAGPACAAWSPWPPRSSSPRTHRTARCCCSSPSRSWPARCSSRGSPSRCSPASSTYPPPTRPRTRSPGPRCSSRPRTPGSPSSTSWSTTTTTASPSRSGPASTSARSPPGSSSPRPRTPRRRRSSTRASAAR